MSAPASAPPAAGRLLPAEMRERLTRLVAEIPVDAGGGSSLLKALVAADLIVEHDLRRAVEIGVYRGRLLLPLALTMRTLGRGEAVGIDPYSAVAAVQHDAHDRGVDLVAWPQQVDWEGIRREVVETAARWDLGDALRLVRARAEDAAGTFADGSVDLLHVDGNHDRAAVERDVATWLPKVRAGGFVLLDDCSWPSVRRVYARVAETHRLVFQLFDCGGVQVDDAGGNDFAVFQMRASADAAVDVVSTR